jgi:hypothetical protein
MKRKHTLNHNPNNEALSRSPIGDLGVLKKKLLYIPQTSKRDLRVLKLSGMSKKTLVLND